MKQRLYRDIAGGQRRGMRTGGSFAGVGAPGFYGNDRFVPADSAGDASEPSGIAEGFQIEQNNVGAAVYLPILQQVVARDIGFVADADEVRQTRGRAAAPVP